MIPPANFIEHTNDGWHRPGQFYPKKLGDDILSVCDGWLPPKPFITKDHLITAFGSCFAINIEEHLRKNGYRTSTQGYISQTSSLLVKCGEGFVNTFSILNQLEWLWEGKSNAIEIWLKYDGKVQKWIDDSQEAGLELLNSTDVFIITLGLAEVAYHKQTGNVLWAGVPESEWKTGEYDYRLTSVSENQSNLVRIVKLIRKYRGNIPIVFTLSPIPLLMTFRPVSCVTANSVSKAILRVAIDAVMGDQHLFYWPAYEIVTAYTPNPWREHDVRHPRIEVIDDVCRAFMRAYCE